MTTKIRTSESRSEEAKKLRERLRRAPADPNNPKIRGEMPKVLTPAERGGVKSTATATLPSAEPAEVKVSRPRKSAKEE